MSNGVNSLYKFGEFCLDAEERVLLRGGEPVALAPKVIDTLFLLVQRNGHIFSKREMMDALWADSFVEESNLTQNIYTLRRVLGTAENGKNFIENVPRRGYRFTASVRVIEEGEMGRKGDGEKGRWGEGENGQPTNDNGPKTKHEIKSATSLSPFLPVSPSPRLPFSLSPVRLGIVAVIVLIAGFAAFRYFSAQVENQPISPIETVNFRKLTFSGDLTFPVLAPDGRSFAFVRGDGVFVQDVESGDEVRLNIEGQKVFGILQFSLDGNSIYFRNRIGFDLAASVFHVSRFGGSPKLIAENVWSGFSFSHDGKQMFFFRVNPNEAENALILKNLETGEEKKLATCKLPSEFLFNTNPGLSPDGKTIAVVIFKKLRTSPISQLMFVNIESGTIEEISVPRLQQFEQVAWMPGGNDLIISAREKGKFFQLWRLAYPGGELQKITNDLNIYRGLSLSADGKKLLARQFTLYSHIWIAERNDLENPRQKTFGNLSRDGLNGITWTPSGDIIYTARIMGDGDLWLYRPSDDSRWQLTKNAGGTHQNAIVSSDGKFVFFNSNRSGTNHIWRMEANGANQTQITFGEKEVETHPQLSPDGTWLYYILKGATASTVWRKSLTDGKSEALTEGGKLAPDSFLSLSPDGKWLAFHNSIETVNEEAEKQSYQIGLISTRERGSAKFIKITASRLVVRWSGDGNALDYIENSPEGARIWRQSVTGDQSPSPVIQMPQAYLHNFAWSADGEKLALSRGRQLNDAILLTDF